MNRPRAYKVLRRSVGRYTTIEPDLPPTMPEAWAAEADTIVDLLLYTDGTTRIFMNSIVQSTKPVLFRADVLLLGCFAPKVVWPVWVAVRANDWQAWQQEIQALGDLSGLPRLRYKNY